MILNRYERMVARRYLLPGKGEGFIFLVASISLARGIANNMVELKNRRTGEKQELSVESALARLTS